MAHKLRGDEIERLMLGRGLNKSQLARAAKISVRTLNRWLGGEAASMDGLLLLAKALGVEADTLRADRQVIAIANALDIHLRVQGSTLMNAPEMQTIIHNRISEFLKSLNITLTNLQVTAAVSELTRTIVLIWGAWDTGASFWVYLAVRPGKYHQFLAAQKEGAIDLYQFEEYGEIIVSGEGKRPPESITEKVAEMYQTDVQKLLASIPKDD